MEKGHARNDVVLVIRELWSFLVYGGIEEVAYPAD
jgi:hypothetical protein